MFQGLRKATVGLSAFLLCALVSTVSSGTASAGKPMVLALKFVEFQDSGGNPVMTRDQMQRVVNGMNQIYSACDIQFRAEDYEAVNPSRYGIDFATSSMNDLDRIRAAFNDPHRLVVINTGPWDHLTMGPANGWTNMPGNAVGGAVLESRVATNAEIVAHELGHYLSLNHFSDASDLMNPVIYSNSTRINPWQCEAVRRSAQTNSALALRG